VPPALLEGEDDAFVDDAAFQLAVGLGGLLHGHGFVRAQAEPARAIASARTPVPTASNTASTAPAEPPSARTRPARPAP
jgi:hypothetical protein